MIYSFLLFHLQAGYTHHTSVDGVVSYLGRKIFSFFLFILPWHQRMRRPVPSPVIAAAVLLLLLLLPSRSRPVQNRSCASSGQLLLIRIRYVGYTSTSVEYHTYIHTYIRTERSRSCNSYVLSGTRTFFFLKSPKGAQLIRTYTQRHTYTYCIYTNLPNLTRPHYQPSHRINSS